MVPLPFIMEINMAKFIFKATSHRIVTADIIINAKNMQAAYDKYYDMSQKEWDAQNWQDTGEFDEDRGNRYEVIVEED